MDRKIKNTIILILVLIILGGGGAVFSYVYLNGKIEERAKKLADLKLTEYDTNELEMQLAALKKQASSLDSILALRKFNIPYGLKQSSFFNFVNKASFSFSPRSFVNIEYLESKPGTNFNFYTYKLSGTAFFNDLYKLVYAIEQSKELKKVTHGEIRSLVEVAEDGMPQYLISFTIFTSVYYADNDRFATSEFKENKLKPNPLYDIFYPLIRKEIPPNINKLLDVQTAQLLALVPDGAFLSDASGNTFLLWEGDEVYLGYLTEIDFDKSEVSFILNKGGIIEKEKLSLEQNENNEKSK